LSQLDTDRKTAKPKTPQDGLAHYGARIAATVYRTGSFTFPPVEIRFRTADGKVIAASSPPVKIEIQSVLSDKDRNLKDLKKQAEITEPVPWIWWLSILAAAGILGALGWLLWKRRRADAPYAPAAPPQDLLDMAEAELRELLAHGMPERTTVKPFYVRLSEIVKRILEAGYRINMAERTTSEIMESLRPRPGLQSEDMERIESFLLHCDIVKFAKYIPSKNEHDDAGNNALRILETSREIVASRQSPVAIESRQTATDD
jgi:hypothetical protein